MLQHLDGVTFAQNGGMGQTISLFVRGSEGRHVLVLMDGVRLPINSTGTADINQIPTSIIQRIEFIRGPRSAVYGSGAIGGVINIITQHKKDIAKFDTQWGTDQYQQYNGAWQQTFAEKVTVSVAGEYEKTVGYNVMPNSDLPSNKDRDGFQSKSLLLGVNYQVIPSFSIFANSLHFANHVKNDALFTIDPQRKVYSDRYATGAKYHHGRFASQLSVTYQKYKDYNYDYRGMYDPKNHFSNTENKTAQWGNTISLNQGMVSFGGDWLEEKMITVDKGYKNDYQRDNTGVYLTSYKTFNQWTIEAAIRADHNQDYGLYKTWQSAFSRTLGDQHRIKLSYGTGFLAPTLQQVNGSKGMYIILPNKDLKPEKSQQIELGLDGYYTNFDWHINLYQNKIKDLIDWEPITDTTSNYKNIKSSTIKGIETDIRFETGPIHHQLGLVYVSPKNDQTGQTLLRRPKRQVKYTVDFKVKEVDISLFYQWNDKSSDAIFDSNFKAKTITLSSYSLVNVAANYPINNHLMIHAKINNFFDKQYETVKDYAAEGRQFYLGASYQF